MDYHQFLTRRRALMSAVCAAQRFWDHGQTVTAKHILSAALDDLLHMDADWLGGFDASRRKKLLARLALHRIITGKEAGLLADVGGLSPDKQCDIIFRFIVTRLHDLSRVFGVTAGPFVGARWTPPTTGPEFRFPGKDVKAGRKVAPKKKPAIEPVRPKATAAHLVTLLLAFLLAQFGCTRIAAMYGRITLERMTGRRRGETIAKQLPKQMAGPGRWAYGVLSDAVHGHVTKRAEIKSAIVTTAAVGEVVR